jgi:iron(III) transport system substrate-binding protein
MNSSMLALTGTFMLAALPASAQGVVNVYCSVQGEWCTLIANEFQKTTGVKVSMS